MFDFHMHTTVSYDGRASATEMALAAKKAGLSEICFTDHMDYDPLPNPKRLTFTPEEYAEAYTESAAKRKGNRRIRMELKGKGLSDEAIEGALTGLDPEQELETAKAILEKYMRGKNPDKEGLQKAYRYLLGKGFDYETAKAAIAAYGEIDDEE